MCAYYCEPTVGYNEHSKYSIPVIASFNRRVSEYGFYLHMGSSCITIEASCVVKKVTTHSLEI